MFLKFKFVQIVLYICVLCSARTNSDIFSKQKKYKKTILDETGLQGDSSNFNVREGFQKKILSLWISFLHPYSFWQNL